MDAFISSRPTTLALRLAFGIGFFWRLCASELS